MAVFDDMMATGGAGLLMQVHGAAQPVMYKPPKSDPFEWSVIVGEQRGGESFDAITGDRTKVIRMRITGPTATLTAKGVLGIQRNASVLIDGTPWDIDIPECQFGPALVRIGLMLKSITSHESMTANGTI